MNTFEFAEEVNKLMIKNGFNPIYRGTLYWEAPLFEFIKYLDDKNKPQEGQQ